MSLPFAAKWCYWQSLSFALNQRQSKMEQLDTPIPQEKLEKLQIISQRLGLDLNQVLEIALNEFIENYNEYLRIVDECEEENIRPNLGLLDNENT